MLVNKKKNFYNSKKLFKNKYIIFLNNLNTGLNNQKNFIYKYSSITDLIMTEKFKPFNLKKNSFKLNTSKNTKMKIQFSKKTCFLKNTFVGVNQYITFANYNDLKYYLQKNQILVKNTILKNNLRYIYLNEFYLDNIINKTNQQILINLLCFHTIYLIQILNFNTYSFFHFITILNKNKINN
uniref:Uncharacterized protein orf181 n=1 Tax=Cyanophora paradoxa TaxID=2762 RepID=E9P1D1_CYAPA|nr:hypothetical protein CYPAM_p12 [Cyanophora paradoxa]ADW79183.1 hypothetical protein [Cyanophora paradoxa]